MVPFFLCLLLPCFTKCGTRVVACCGLYFVKPRGNCIYSINVEGSIYGGVARLRLLSAPVTSVPKACPHIHAYLGATIFRQSQFTRSNRPDGADGKWKNGKMEICSSAV